MPNECSHPRGLPRPAGAGGRRLSAQQVRPDGAYLRRYRLHRQRLHEGVRESADGVPGAGLAGLCGADPPRRRGEELTYQDERLPRLLRDGAAGAYRAAGCDVCPREAGGLPRDRGENAAGRRGHRTADLSPGRRVLSPAGGYPLLQEAAPGGAGQLRHQRRGESGGVYRQGRLHRL